MKRFIQLKLKILAKMILAKYKPDVVGITGSVGKTSAKEAVYTVLSKKFKVRRNIGNYNNEIGVPLTIIGMDSPGRSIFGWLRVFWQAGKLILIKDKNYPRILVLEMGVDRPGDMKYLNSIVKCKVGVVTLIGPAHLEFFHSIESIQKEKGRLIQNLAKSGWAVLNYDNGKTRQIAKMSKARILTYGFGQKADVRAQQAVFSFEEKGGVNSLEGISFKLSYKGSFVPILLLKVVGYGAVYAALAGAAVGLTYDFNLVEISESLRQLESPRGRMNLIKGIKNTLIIDDTYNSSPQSAIAALDIMKMISISSHARKIAVLGDMLELGSYSQEGHRLVGKHLVKSKINKLIAVGERANDIVYGAEEAGMSRDHIFHFAESIAAGKFVQSRIKENDLILVKGSQGVRMEKIVKEIMAEPWRNKELLVRQDEQWLNR